MRKPVIAIAEADNLTNALMKFLRHPVKRLVVVSDDNDATPVGMLTPFDIIKALPIAEMSGAGRYSLVANSEISGCIVACRLALTLHLVTTECFR